MGHNLLITIDGPAGAGKSTVARALARALGCRYLDSGAFYRAVAWEAVRRGLDLESNGALAGLLAVFAPEAGEDDHGFFLLVHGRRLAQELRTPEISLSASQVAKIPAVRRWVTTRLRQLAAGGGVVAEGRDLGSVVFPQAHLKFYLDADLNVRAARRQQEQAGAGAANSLGDTRTALAVRDAQDRSRAEAPLTVPPGAIRIDTTHLQPEEVVARCLAEVHRWSAGQTTIKPVGDTF